MTEKAQDQQFLGAGRFKAFVDAVVAIALTLLILPLMESVSDAGDEGATTMEWLQGHLGQVASFLVSFVVIAVFWMRHHYVFAGVRFVSAPLMLVTFAWMLTIVWLPVATAISSQFDPDPAQLVLYIGVMALTSALSGVTDVYLLHKPALHEIPAITLRHDALGAFTASGLFVLALIVAIVVPAVGYWALLLLFLAGPVQAGLTRFIRTE